MTISKTWKVFTDPPSKQPHARDVMADGWWATCVPSVQAPGGSVEVGTAALPAHLVSALPSLVVTDVDSTLINEEVIDHLADLAGHRKQVEAITERAMNGEIDFEASLLQRVALLRGLPAEALAQVAASITLTPGAKTLVDWVHRVGGRFGIVSGGFTQVVAPIAQELGIDLVRAIDLDIEQGLLTGGVAGPILDAQGKAETLKEWAGGQLSTTVAVGDGANDIPMLKTAGLGIAFCANPAVAKTIGNRLDLRRLDAVAGLLGHNPAR